MTVSGTGDVTLELDGKNELTGGTGTVENEYIITRARAGLKSEMGKTTITDSDGDGTLIATGGKIVVDDSYASAKSGQYAAGFGIDGAVIAGGTVVAKGGDVVFESSAEQKENSYIFFSTGSGILTPEISGGIVEATGGSAIGNGTLGALSEAGSGVGGEDYSAWKVQTKITGGTVKATGGNAKNSGGSRGGFGIRVDSNNGKGGLSISGGTVIAQAEPEMTAAAVYPVQRSPAAVSWPLVVRESKTAATVWAVQRFPTAVSWLLAVREEKPAVMVLIKIAQ